jgi:hypothetical protein
MNVTSTPHVTVISEINLMDIVEFFKIAGSLVLGRQKSPLVMMLIIHLH